MPVTVLGKSISNAKAAEAQAAFKRYWNMDSDPTVADVEKFAFRHINSVVRKYRAQLRNEANAVDQTDIL